MKNILIIKCGETYDQIKTASGDFDEMIIKRSNLPHKVFKVYEIYKGEKPRHPGEYIAAIITGSHSNIDEKQQWIKQLKDWIITARYSNIPVLGICFGHQIIAEALGGKVEKSTKGMKAGCENIKLTPAGSEDPLFKNIKDSLISYKSHQYFISKAPPEATTLAKNDEGTIESFKVGKIYGVQFHPEFSNSEMEAYININKGNITPVKKGVKMKHEFKNEAIIPNFIDLSLIF
ncbi:MAG: gamma-glutamyl-gamma-aminobutyrate hydrolase family protein [Prolixibacteraceae bacterium]|nr:gamma-glutamyl-gamma-aminobutyrate hydrolase family protein [Prolixibacteraceae bacterium]